MQNWILEYDYKKINQEPYLLQDRTGIKEAQNRRQ